MKRIGILGGTFDPPHIGHLIIAEEVRMRLELEEIWFIPTYEPPHKKKATTEADMRVGMLEKAIEDNPFFHMNTIEMEREGKSYTLDTMKLLHDRYPNTEFYFIIGGDMVEYLPKWHKIKELLNYVTFVGLKRPGYSFHTAYPVLEVEVPLINISSSEIRERVMKKEPFRYFVPKSVYTFIKGNRLYE
ncbi:nicotinate-nucleotide adenylyltransferase [Oceanobacillus limi]|uniref:Probable nicotinate-nucleotide adenylyltransferase n=1 Tax=Oceanobacillus limi TaxID=930131 RepID=A0A1I0FUP6_9BACI|nr:nicotinate-nucleotide adenylyltransferase [Oceanobacillus limi]SET62022.1 nicotinate-nucleotide adenylyltransferase [Oceanobacillus limi]